MLLRDRNKTLTFSIAPQDGREINLSIRRTFRPMLSLKNCQAISRKQGYNMGSVATVSLGVKIKIPSLFKGMAPQQENAREICCIST
jgi:hypothetical protein